MKNCLLKLSGRSVQASACAFMAFAVCANMSYAADVVPDDWNVAPMRSGAYLQSFESTIPDWADATGSSKVTTNFPTNGIPELPARSNAWFASGTQVLQLETDGTVLTNELEDSSSGSVVFGLAPVYVDMRVRFQAMAEAPDTSLLSSCKLAVYVSEDAKLVVVHSSGSWTNTTELDTNKWHQVSVKMEDGGFDVSLDDTSVYTGSLQSSGTDNQLDSVSFHGSGYIDELYVSHGAPDYPVVGPAAGSSIPTLPTGGNVPTDQEQTRINTWLSEQSGLTGLGIMTRDELSIAYMVDEIDTPTGAAVTYGFGIAAIDLVTPNSIKITAELIVNSAIKQGTINGRIQLQGRKVKGGTLDILGVAVTPGAADFTSGKAIYTYTIPTGGYKFFKATIIPLEEI